MAFSQYKRGQTIGRFLRYLYDGYEIHISDHWTFGAKLMSGSTVVANILPVADPDDPPMFKFVGEYARFNKVQTKCAKKVRLEEIHDIVQDGFEKYRDGDKDFEDARRDFKLLSNQCFARCLPDKLKAAELVVKERESILQDKFAALCATLDKGTK